MGDRRCPVRARSTCRSGDESRRSSKAPPGRRLRHGKSVALLGAIAASLLVGCGGAESGARTGAHARPSAPHIASRADRRPDGPKLSRRSMRQERRAQSRFVRHVRAAVVVFRGHVQRHPSAGAAVLAATHLRQASRAAKASRRLRTLVVPSRALSARMRILARSLREGGLRRTEVVAASNALAALAQRGTAA